MIYTVFFIIWSKGSKIEDYMLLRSFGENFLVIEVETEAEVSAFSHISHSLNALKAGQGCRDVRNLYRSSVQGGGG